MGKFRRFVLEAITIDRYKDILSNIDLWNYKDGYAKDFDNGYRKVIGEISPDITILKLNPLFDKIQKLALSHGYKVMAKNYVDGYAEKGK